MAQMVVQAEAVLRPHFSPEAKGSAAKVTSLACRQRRATTAVMEQTKVAAAAAAGHRRPVLTALLVEVLAVLAHRTLLAGHR